MSSRMQELAAERRAVADALEAMDVDPFVFEVDAGARPGTIVGTYREELLACDVYLGLFWLGWGDYTNDEYRTAAAAGLPCLIYEKRPGAGQQRDPALTAFLDRIGHVEGGDVTTAWFDDAAQLAQWVRRDIDRLRDDALRRQTRVGTYIAKSTGLGARLDVGEPPVIKLRQRHLAGCAAPPSPFVGRDRPLSRIRGALSNGSSLVGFRGEPGMGKSALLAKLVADIAAGYPDGAVCVQAADHASYRDALNDVWTRYHDVGDGAFVPTDAELAGGLATRHALVTFDDLQIPASDVEQLGRAMPKSDLVVTGAPADDGVTIDSLAYVKAITLEGLTEDADVLTIFEAAYGEPVPDDAKAAVVAACHAAGGGPGHIRRLAHDAWGSDESLAAWAQSAVGPLPSGQQETLNLVAAAGPAVAMPTGVAEKLGVTAEQLAALEAAGLLKAASPRFRLDAPPPGAANALDAGWLGHIATATAEWTQTASPDELTESRAFVAWAAERAVEAGDHETVMQLARIVGDTLAAHGLWGAWGRLLEAARSSAHLAQDARAEGWALHQLGTRVEGLEGTGAGSEMLRDAARLRFAIGDLDGAALSQHNLRTIEQVTSEFADADRDGDGDGDTEADAQRDADPTTRQNAVEPTTRLPLTDGTPTEVLPTVRYKFADPDGTPTQVHPRELLAAASLSPPWWRNPWVWGAAAVAAVAAAVAVVALDPFGGSDTPPPATAPPVTAGALSPDPDRVDLGTLPVGESAAPQTVAFTNSGDAALNDLVVQLDPAGTFFVVEDRCSGTSLQPADRCEVAVGYTAAAAGSLEALLTVSSGDVTATATVVGSGDFGVLVPSPESVDFGAVQVGEQQRQEIALANQGGVDIVIGSVTLDGPQSFALASDCGRLAPGAACRVEVAFGPQESGDVAANIVVTAGNEPLTIAVSGTGVAGILSVAEPVDVGTVEVGQRAVAEAFVSNVGNGPLEILDVAQTSGADDFALQSDNCTGTMLDPGEQCELGIIFRPREPVRAAGSFDVVARSRNGPEQRAAIVVTGTGTQAEVPEREGLLLDRTGIVDILEFGTPADEAEKVLGELLGEPDADGTTIDSPPLCFGSDERTLEWDGFLAVLSADDAGNDDVFGPQRFVGWYTTRDIDSSRLGFGPERTVLSELIAAGAELVFTDDAFASGPAWQALFTDGVDAGTNFYFDPALEFPTESEPVLAMGSSTPPCEF